MTLIPRDRRGASIAAGFVLLLLASEAALTLPDETDGAQFVADFYATHRPVVIGLQLVGLVAAGLLARYAARLRSTDALVGTAGLVTAVLACAPGVATIILAAVADPSTPARAGVWTQRQAWADDLLFVGIVVFGLAVAIRLRSHPVVATLGGLTALLCGTRLALGALGSRGPFDSLGAATFILLVAALAIRSWRGTRSSRTARASAKAAPG